MIRELLSGSDLLDLPVAATVLFFCLFVGAVAWVMRRSRKEHYHRMARMPLEDGENEGGAR